MGDVDMLNLNLVVSAPAVADPAKGRSAHPNKPLTKRRNKYEKRREKSRQAKRNTSKEDRIIGRGASTTTSSAPSQIISSQPQPQTAAMAETSESSSSTVNPDHRNPQKQETEETPNDTTHSTAEEIPTDVSESSNNEESQIQTEPLDSTGGPGAEPLKPLTTTAGTESSVPVTTETVSSEVAGPASRKNHNSSLQDSEARAKYMADYHARPLEMDRRSGATSRIQPSKESTHIFEEETDSANPTNHGTAENKANDATDTTTTTTGGPFSQLGLHSNLVHAVTSPRGPFRLERPTIIQARAIQQLLQTDGRNNLFIQSETGSGKTLAYLLPILQSLGVEKKGDRLKKVDRQIGGTRCIVVCPTRELATQTCGMAEQLCRHSFSWIVPGCLSGGEKRKSEKARLRKGVTLLVATPGRLLDHLDKTECLTTSLEGGKLEWLVLDEADRLLDMGLGGQIEQIVQQHLRRTTNNAHKITWRSVLVSATVTDQIEQLAKKTLGDMHNQKWLWARAKSEEVAKDSSSMDHDLFDATPRQLAQSHMVVTAKLRLSALVAFLAARVKKNERTVVFMSTCDGVEYHHKLFSQAEPILGSSSRDMEQKGLFGSSCPVHRLHGNVPHAERHAILQKFGEGVNKRNGSDDDTSTNLKRAAILIATDVAARGLNLPGVDWIVQYDPPCETSDYIHRAGRAARAGKAGHALLFLLPSERQYMDVLELRGLKGMSALSLSSTLQTAAGLCPEVTLEGQKRSGGGYGTAGQSSRDGEAFAAALQLRLEDCVEKDDNNYKDELARKIKALQAQQQQDKTLQKKARKSLKHATGPLMEAARKAYSAYIRAYPAKEKPIRHIFCARALHLGHIARSFALKEQPKQFIKSSRHDEAAETNDEDILKSTGKKRSSRLAFNTSSSDRRSSKQKVDHESELGEPKQNASKIISFVNDEDNAIENAKSSKTTEKKSSVQSKMMSNAERIQNSGMEFF